MDRMTKERLISDFVNRRVWAVVGASQDRSKYGNIVYRNLRDAGYTVYPVNPRVGKVEGATAYPTLADLPEMPDVIDLVVPPPTTEKVVEEAWKSGLTRIWMQPGAESKAAIEYCRVHDMQVVYDACAMVHRRQWD
jgi:predicted CoA-binding protein